PPFPCFSSFAARQFFRYVRQGRSGCSAVPGKPLLCTLEDSLMNYIDIVAILLGPGPTRVTVLDQLQWANEPTWPVSTAPSLDSFSAELPHIGIATSDSIQYPGKELAEEDVLALRQSVGLRLGRHRLKLHR